MTFRNHLSQIKEKRVPFIVLGGGINGLAVARNLGRNGIDVYCVADKNDVVAYSKYCKRFYLVRLLQNREALKHFLKCLEEKVPKHTLLLPTTDLGSLYLADLKTELTDRYLTLSPKREVVETLVNKKKFYESLSKHRIPYPKTYFVQSIGDVERISGAIEYPVFLRPSISQSFRLIFRRKGFVAHSAEELTKYYLLVSKCNIETMIQEIIPGEPENVFNIAGYFDRNSQPKGLCAYRRLRAWPTEFGTSSLMQSIPISDVGEIKETTVAFLHSLEYQGIMEAEFLKDPRDGTFKFIEINARSSWQNSLPTECGINLILMAYLDFVGESIEHTEQYRPGVKWIYFRDDLRSSIKMICKGEMTVNDWLSSLKGVRSHAFFAPDDPLPMCVQPLIDGFQLYRRMLS